MRVRLAPLEHLRAWLTTVVARVCLDMLRSRRSRREEPFTPDAPEPAATGARGSSPEQEALLADSVGLVCPHHRAGRNGSGGFVQKMLEAGASGYVLKQNATTTLVKAVRTCMGGVAYVDAGVKSSTPTSARAVAAMPIVKAEHEPLTTIEDDVLRLFGTALTLQEIATQLGLEREEVARVRDAAMRKLGIATRVQAINYVRSRNPDATS